MAMQVTKPIFLEGLLVKYSGYLDPAACCIIPSKNTFIPDCLCVGAFAYVCIVNGERDEFGFSGYSALFERGITAENIDIAIKCALHRVSKFIDDIKE